ncbi:DUF1636 domain-containing protein [Capilliphycus salinus ALCB114379]|uniref:DUF1636 domain-containing protein n=1 Tax=Capilliphycus salinus TaxID=2768948 RepID=UPI0039A52F02
MTKHTIFVCTACASVWKGNQRVGESGGEKLHQQLSQLSETWELKAEFSIEPVTCMSACKRSCVVAFSASQKPTYLFGNLSSPDAAHSILECASKYYLKPDGKLPRKERPELLKQRIIACVPPQLNR